ncbi:MAG TPA: UDP-N-acetylmuramoyl-tripeptide--D-alanyl-D-alanine ligase [Flavipsychrobacter sp.]|nr:UDP-N-acetylmuramoyl-tripeptide--D-alanyl-D-alanine ligase [Flavipsychrobacter sp.]
MSTAELYLIYLQYPHIQTDTRKLTPGELFFALKGDNFNGNQFAQKALDAGASYAVIDEPFYATDPRCILVEDVLTTLQGLARHHRLQFQIPFIGITGSNGKTTTKELITAVLKQTFVTYATEGNLNNHIGVPLTVLKIGKDAQMAVIEMGANHLHEIEGYCEIALPTHAIITNCGKAHLEGFGSEEGVRKGKGELYDFIRENNGTIFRNTDLSYLKDMALGIDHQITYGSGDAYYIGKPLQHEVFLKIALLTSGLETTLTTRLAGDFNFPNVMAAVAIGAHFGISADSIKSAIESYSPDNSRSQFIQIQSNKIILDAYNANPTSMRAAIKNFAASGLPGKMLWLGAMKEMGNEEKSEHAALVTFVKEFDWEHVIWVGKEFEGLIDGFMWFENSAQAAIFIANHMPQNASVLIKGSRGSKMELLLEALKKH